VALATKHSKSKKECSLKLDSVRIANLTAVCDAISWLDHPTPSEIAQFSNIDTRTVGKVSKNGRTLGLFDVFAGDRHRLTFAYPPQGSEQEKLGAIRAVLIRNPIVQGTRDFLKLGDNVADAFRKACTKAKITNYDETSTRPLLSWATDANALDLQVSVETLQTIALQAKAERKREEFPALAAFLSHSSRDKDFVRRLAADLTSRGVTVWLDEQDILAGQSFVERISEGIYASDVFLFISSEDSVKSEWAKKELNLAFSRQLSKADVQIIPAKIDDAEVPKILKDIHYADFRKSYEDGLSTLLRAMAWKEKKRD
jgi:hypothetical protein